jgi:uncharacterized membrane protein YecN with MAPEG domain
MISMMYAGLCTLLVIYLALRVVKWRREHKIGLGHGENMELQQRVRAHANATENMPLALILLGSLELTGFQPLWIHILGGTFLFSRIIHAYGVSHNSGYSKGRFYGMLLTWLPMIAMACFAIVGSIAAQMPAS